MPPPPELLRTLRFIRAVEVHRQIETHQHSYADGYIRVSREVRIHLQRVGKERKEVLKAGEEQRVVKDTVYQVYC